jgi:hypothetical protein
VLNRAEFQVGKRVSYWNGKTFFKGRIDDLRLNPITESVEYLIKYKPSSTSKGFSRVLVQPREIKESEHFKGDK